MFLNLLDQLEPEEIVRRLYDWLLSGTSDLVTADRLRDRRLIPALVTIISAGGRPSFAPAEVSDADAERVTASAAYLLGDIARPGDEEAVAALRALLDQDSDRVALAASVALGQIGATEASAQVLAFTRRMMDRGELGAVSRLTRTLARIGDEDALDYLRGLVSLKSLTADDKQYRYVMGEVEKTIDELTRRLG